MQLQFFKLQIKRASGGSIAHGPVGVHGDTDSPRLAPPVTLWSLGSKSHLLGRALWLLVVAGGDPNGASFVSGQPREAQNQELRVHTRPRAKTSKNE